MKTSLIGVSAGVVLGAAALIGAGTAYADDDTFVGTLEIIGVPVADRDAAVAMGHNACALLDQGLGPAEVAGQLATDNGLTGDQAGYVVGVSIAAYCDHHRGLVGEDE